MTDKSKGKPNKLINSISPYLLQHAYNPINWYEWGDEALKKAKKENKVIFLSIGYSTCYWCHVMEREVFEDEEIAKLVNDSIICIKVDREQHPDLDEVYMMATQLITGSGGWPNNIFVTPDLKPFFAGTYFSARNDGNRIGFTTVVKRINELWQNNQSAIMAQADYVAKQIKIIKQKEEAIGDDSLPNVSVINELFDFLSQNYDKEFGGFYQAPKFPHENLLLFLLKFHALQNNHNALEMIKNTLERMSQGGIYDHVGGGFHRYSTDEKWHIPHFEKMLYNQALLSKIYLIAYEQFGDLSDKDIATRTLNFVINQMVSEKGFFVSALDAETEEIEGAHYVWCEQELKDALNLKEYKWLRQYYDLTSVPAISGHNNVEGEVLYMKATIDDIAAKEKISAEKVIEQKNAIMKKLLMVRNKRKAPFLDDKLITSWNGLMIDSFVFAGVILKEESYIKVAKKAADFIFKNLIMPDGKLYRIWRNNKVHIEGTFEDYAFLISGIISLYFATKDQKYLNKILELMKMVKKLFADDIGGGYYFTQTNQRLLVRSKNAVDSALPSANAVMLHNLLNLYQITEEDIWQEKAKKLLGSFNRAIESSPASYAYMIDGLLSLQTQYNVTSRLDLDNDRTLNSNSKVKASILKDSVRYVKSKVLFDVQILVDDEWYINANSTSLNFDIIDSKRVIIKKINYPKPKNLESLLGNIKIYKGKIIIPIKLEVLNKSEINNLKLKIKIQVCKDKTCLLPSNFVLSLNFIQDKFLQ